MECALLLGLVDSCGSSGVIEKAERSNVKGTSIFVLILASPVAENLFIWMTRALGGEPNLLQIPQRYKLSLSFNLIRKNTSFIQDWREADDGLALIAGVKIVKLSNAEEQFPHMTLLQNSCHCATLMRSSHVQNLGHIIMILRILRWQYGLITTH